jgi:hypothetical protein
VAIVRNGVVRLVRACRSLALEQRHAALGAAALLVTMLLPWYGEDTYDEKLHHYVHESLNAFAVFSWVEAAIFLVSLGVLLLLFYRAEQRAFHLPGGDGTVILAAGLWAAFLFLWRVFDRPSATGNATTVGIQWGFFFAFLAAGALAFAGYRVRSARPPEPTRAQDPTTREEPAPPPRSPMTQSTRRVRRPRPTAGPAGPARGSESPTRIAGQLSFEESEPDPYE